MIYSFLQIIFSLSEEIYISMEEYEQGTGVRIGYDGIMSLLGGYLGFVLLMFIAYYVLRSIGLYKMAKNRGFSNPKLCFVPFYALFMVSKLRSEGEALKKHGLYPIFAVSALGLFVALSAFIDGFFSIRILIQLTRAEREVAGSGILTAEMFTFYDKLADVLSELMSISEAAYFVFIAMLYCDLFRTYAPIRTKTHLILSILFDVITGSSLLYGAFTLALSNRTAVNFDEILEKRKIYYGYGNPYAGKNFNNDENRRQEDSGDDPFADFSDNAKSGSGDPFSEFSDGSNHGANHNDNSEPFDDFSTDKTENYDKGASDDARKNDDDSDSLF